MPFCFPPRMTVEAAPSRSAVAAVLADLPPNVWTKAPLVEADVEAELHAAILGHTLDPQSPLADGL